MNDKADVVIASEGLNNSKDLSGDYWATAILDGLQHSANPETAAGKDAGTIEH